MINSIVACWEITSHETGTEGMTWSASTFGISLRERICRRCRVNPGLSVIHDACVFKLHSERGLEVDTSHCMNCGKRLGFVTERFDPAPPHEDMYTYHRSGEIGYHVRDHRQAIVPQYGDSGPIS